MALDRKQIFEYYKKNPSSIVDASITDPMKVLSTNTYQKAGWVLNMLRHKLGDEIFWKGIKAYYKKYRDSNAMTVDFQKVMEVVSDENLNDYFQQWIFTKGHPEIKWDWIYKNGKVKITLEQIQGHHLFSFPLEIEIQKEGKSIFEIEFDSRPSTVNLDPNLWLLFEEY